MGTCISLFEFSLIIGISMVSLLIIERVFNVNILSKEEMDHEF